MKPQTSEVLETSEVLNCAKNIEIILPTYLVNFLLISQSLLGDYQCKIHYKLFYCNDYE